MKPYTIIIKYRQGDSIVQKTLQAFTRMQVLEQLGITDSDIIQCKVLAGM
jgi:hypothetical protein